MPVLISPFAYCGAEMLLEDVEQPVLRAEAALLGNCVEFDARVLHEAFCGFQPRLDYHVEGRGLFVLAETERKKLRRDFEPYRQSPDGQVFRGFLLDDCLCLVYEYLACWQKVC